MRKAPKSEGRGQSTDHAGQVDQDVKGTDEAEVDSASDETKYEVLEEFLEVAVRLSEAIHRWAAQIPSGDACLYHDPDIDSEIQALKANNTSINKIIAGLRKLKNLQDARLKDLAWLKGL